MSRGKFGAKNPPLYQTGKRTGWERGSIQGAGGQPCSNRVVLPALEVKQKEIKEFH
jgi:hypothetical protein